MNNIENIGLKYRLDVNNQIPNNITQKEEFEKHENEYFGCYFVEAFFICFSNSCVVSHKYSFATGEVLVYEMKEIQLSFD